MREYKFRGKRVDNGEWVYGVPYAGWSNSFEVDSDNPRIVIDIEEVE